MLGIEPTEEQPTDRGQQIEVVAEGFGDPTLPPWPFSLSRLSARTSVIVEYDRFGEAPHIYVVRGPRKAVVIDTGCGTADLFAFLKTCPEYDGLDFQVINTHVHYDHIMGNHAFCSSGGSSLGPRCLGICQGARDRSFSKRWQETSLQAMVKADIQNFCVSDWLEEGQRIFLDDTATSEHEALEVLYTPGHTPDSISLYLPAENRLFTGDLLYPGSIYLFLPGSRLDEFEESIGKLQTFIAGKPEGMVLSCGHITPSLPADRVGEMHSLLAAMRGQGVRPRPASIPWSREPLAAFESERRTFSLLCRRGDVKAQGSPPEGLRQEPARG